MANIVNREIPEPTPDMRFTDPSLQWVLTLSEASVMWGKSETALRVAMWKGQISGRKSFTGGNILISYLSLVDHYGEPKKDTIQCLLSK